MKYLLPLTALAFVLLSGAQVVEDEKDNKRCDSQKFDGEKRKKAKTSIGSGKVEGPYEFDAFVTFINALPQEVEMEDKTGKYKLNQTSKRCKPEQRNVKVICWMYTYARESDEDFHVIFGGDPATDDGTYLSAEISGLPGSAATSYKKLKKARADFLTIIGKDDWCQGYSKELYDAPIKVEIVGSLFFETEHGCNSSGPADYKASSCWEVHPISSIKKAQ